MGKACCICGPLRQGVSNFNVPKNLAMYKRWYDSIHTATGLSLRHKDSVCERHFPKECIKDHVTINDVLGRTLFHRKLMKKALDKKAVPSIFVCETKFVNCNGAIKVPALSDYEVEEITIKEEHTIDDISQSSLPSSCSEDLLEIQDHTYASSVKTEIDCLTDGSIKEEIDIVEEYHELEITEDVINEDSESEMDLCLKNETVKSPDFSLTSIINKIGEIVPQNGNWSYSVQQHPNKLILEEAKISKKISWCNKQIIIYEDLSMQVYLMCKPYLESPNVVSVENVKMCFNQVDTLQICNGGPEFDESDNVSLKCAYKDCSGYWRHNSCKLQVDGEQTCQYCENLIYCYIIRKSCHGLFAKRNRKEST